MSLIKNELRKFILSKKAILILGIYFLLIGSAEVTAYLDRDSENSELLTSFEGPYNQKLYDLSLEKGKEFISLWDSGVTPTQQEEQDFSAYRHYARFGRAYNRLYINAPLEDPEYPKSLPGIKKRLQSLSEAGKRSTLEFRRLQDQMTRISERPEPVFQQPTMWTYLFETVLLSATDYYLVFVLIIMAVPFFSHEKASKMLPLIFSTPQGKKKIITAKIFSAQISTILIWLFGKLMHFIIHTWFFGLEGWDLPVFNSQYFMFSPITLTNAELFTLTTLFQCLTLSATVALALWISVISSRPYKTLIIMLAIYSVPLFIRDIIGIENRLISTLFEWSLMDLLMMSKMILQYHTLPFPGGFVPTLYLIPLYAIGITLLFTYLTFRNYCRQKL